MTRRQTAPYQWLIVNRPDLAAVRSLRRGSGVIVLCRLTPVQDRQIRHIGRSRRLFILSGARRHSARVHNQGELTLALLRRSPMILLSPLYATTSHPDWKPLPRMRAATLARLANRSAIALGGMNQDRFAQVAPLGFTGWAGISAFRT